MSIKRRWLVGAGIAAAAVACAGCKRPGAPVPGAPAPASRVLVLGIDGGTWAVMRPMIEAGELPHLAKLYRAGVHGTLRSHKPTSSPVAWSTIFTGRLPRDHGLVGWETSQSQHRRVKALWEITSGLGLPTDVFNVPSTFPPTPVAGVMISGFPLSGATVEGNTGVVASAAALGEGAVGAPYAFNEPAIREALSPLAVGGWSPWFAVQVRDHPAWRAVMRAKRLAQDRYYLSPLYRTDAHLAVTHPRGLLARLKGVLGQRPYIPEGPGWVKYAEPETPEYLFEHLLQVSEIQSAAATAFAPGRFRLLIYVSTLVDRVCHPYWPYSHPQDYLGVSEERAERFAYAVAQSYRETDKQLGALLARVAGPVYVVLASDHGFRSHTDRRDHLGAHDLAGIYLVAGPKISGRPGGEANIEDITPTVLYLLDLPVADDMTGKVIAEVRAALGRRPRRVPSYEARGAARGTAAPVDEETLRQIRGLGYVNDHAQ